MINEQKLKLFMRMIEKNNKQSKHFSFELSLQGNKIEGLNNKFKLLLTDHSSTKYQIGFSVVVGSIENFENFIVFGIRTGEDTIILDLVDLANDVVYDLFVIDDFVGMNDQKRMVEIDEKMTITSKKLNYVLKKIGKEGFSGIDFEEIEKFESNVLKKDSTYSFFKKHLIKLLSSDEYMKYIANNMHKELLTMETKVYVNIINNYFSTNKNCDIADYSQDKNFIKEFRKQRYKGLDKIYELFTKYPSEIYSLYDNIKSNVETNAVFPQFEDMTTYLK